MPSLADLYSTIDSYKRRAADVLSDPQNSLMQMLGYANDRSREYNENLAQSLGVERAKLRGQHPTLADLNADKYIAEEMANSVIGGMTTWHGSPHTFNKFDLSKIGTGEGSQAYGHGLYVAQNPNVAKEYQKIVQGPESTAQQYLKEYKTRKEAISALEYGITPNLTPEAKKFSEDAINILKSGKELKGNLYKVDLSDEHIEKMLDWDKPLSQQPKNVQDALAKLNPDMYNPKSEDFDPAERGQWTYMRLAGQTTQKNASDKLADLGIPGIKYLDEQSRGAGEGTRNFVIFDPNIAKIEERNSIPIPQDPYAPNYLEDVHNALAQKPIDVTDVHAPNYLEDIHNQLANQQ